MTYALVVLVALAAAGGVAWAVRRRIWALPVYAAGAVISCLLFFPFVTPWIEGKALAMAAPAVPVAALAACAPLFASGRRVEGAVLATLVTGGVLWSNALQYHDVWLAPRAQLAELEGIGERFAGQGPALMTEFNPYGVRHLLRKVDAEGASELRIRPIPLRNGQLLAKAATANIDEFDQGALRVYRTLVLRRSPAESRPPSDYRLVSSGRWYDVWQRDGAASQVLEHLPLGDGATTRRRAGLLRGRSAGPCCGTGRPAGRGRAARDGRRAHERRAEDVTVDVPLGGGYGIWMDGSIRNRLKTAVDGVPLSDVRHHLDYPGQYTLLGMAELAAGEHVVELQHSAGGLLPGSGVEESPRGPLVLSLGTPDAPVTIVPVADARRLCGKRFDWIEALSG